MPVMFRGQYAHTIDSKGRTSLPSRFREQLVPTGDMRVVLTPALTEPCIHVFPMSAWEQLEAKVAALPQFDPSVVRLRRRYVSAAVDGELDRQGRILVPPQLREHAQLTKDVFWAGVGSKVELWARDRWLEAVQVTTEELRHLERQLAEWGL